MTAPAQVVFLPGFDGAAGLRGHFVAALGAYYPTRAVGYPDRPLGSLEGYCEFARDEAGPEASPRVLVAESFSGLVAAVWAARDPAIAAVVLCGAFASNPVGWLASVGAAVPGLARLGARALRAFPPASSGALHQEWSAGFTAALAALSPAVVAERLRLIAHCDVGALLAALRSPVVLVQFDHDQVVRARARGQLEAVCHNAHIVRFAGPHFALEVAPRECAAAIGGELRKVLTMTDRPRSMRDEQRQ
jgi:hypothetical protein